MGVKLHVVLPAVVPCTYSVFPKMSEVDLYSDAAVVVPMNTLCEPSTL